MVYLGQEAHSLSPWLACMKVQEDGNWVQVDGNLVQEVDGCMKSLVEEDDSQSSLVDCDDCDCDLMETLHGGWVAQTLC